MSLGNIGNTVSVEYLAEHGEMDLQLAYYHKFGEFFVAFNHVDFPDTEDKRGEAIYLEALKEAIEKDEPTRIKLKWREPNLDW